ncbi:MAG: N-(5-phosphoribosyl)anthranilate isomerase [Planctomycetota bacterium]
MAQPLFRVKICGVTSVADAAVVAEAGADAIGFNFVPGSPRAVAAATAAAARRQLPEGVLVVGVFAGMAAAEILALASEVGLDAVQLHGHLEGAGPAVDPPSLCGAFAELPGLRIIRAVRMGPDGLAAARRWIAAAESAGRAPDMVIVDAGVPRDAAGGLLGGTGHRVDWQALAREADLGLPMALAGGLTPANVAQAIAATGARGVDTASGVESAPGRKDPELIRAFVAAAQAALGAAA